MFSSLAPPPSSAAGTKHLLIGPRCFPSFARSADGWRRAGCLSGSLLFAGKQGAAPPVTPRRRDGSPKQRRDAPAPGTRGRQKRRQPQATGSRSRRSSIGTRILRANQLVTSTRWEFRTLYTTCRVVATRCCCC